MLKLQELYLNPLFEKNKDTEEDICVATAEKLEYFMMGIIMKNLIHYSSNSFIQGNYGYHTWI